MKKIYLAVPYSGMEESSYSQVTRLAALIISKTSDNVFSPITLSHPLTKYSDLDIPSDWSYWSKVDYQYIDWCDELWVLVPKEGIEMVRSSIGVQAEISYAQDSGKSIKWIRVIGNDFEFI